jgi:hypothetical protein
MLVEILLIENDSRKVAPRTKTTFSRTKQAFGRTNCVGLRVTQVSDFDNFKMQARRQ